MASFTLSSDLAENQPSRFRLPSSAHIGKVKLAVSNLGQSIAFYTDVIGLSVLDRTAQSAALGILENSTVLLELQELQGVEPIRRRSRLGLYHPAFLLPTREALSSFVNHLVASRVQFGAGDHIYSEAIYVTDPDGLSVEIYADRPRGSCLARSMRSDFMNFLP